MSAASARTQALRLRVFRFILDTYEAEGRWPTERETAREFGIARRTASDQLRKLHGANGLPKPTNRRGDTRLSGRQHLDGVAYTTPVDAAIRDMGRRYNPETYIDVRSWS